MGADNGADPGPAVLEQGTHSRLPGRPLLLKMRQHGIQGELFDSLYSEEESPGNGS